MSAPTTQISVDFLDWLFGPPNENYIHLWGTRDAGDKKDSRFIFCKNAKELATGSWEEQLQPQFNLYFCTSKVSTIPKTSTGTPMSGKDGKLAAEVPALWFDIDACKKFFDARTQNVLVTGSEFYQDMRTQEPDVSAWVRSSEHGIQGYYKLDAPWLCPGKEAFDELIEPLLCDIMWYYGGDPKTCHISSMMRLPGTRNKKPEYTTAWPVTAETRDTVHSLTALKKKFKPDFDACPRVVAYAIFKIAQEFWTQGERNGAAMALAGSIRQAGIDKASCLRLFKEIYKVFKDDEVRSAQVESTYDHDFDSLANVAGINRDLGNTLNTVLTFWLELKEAYAKKRDIQWQRETHDPTQPNPSAPGNKQFWVQDRQTWAKDQNGDPRVVANFTLRVLKRIRKVDGSLNALVLITKKDGTTAEVEIAAISHSSFIKFTTVNNLPYGISFNNNALWANYVMQIDDEAELTPIVTETAYYGILDDHKLFLPDDDSAPYAWARESVIHDTALPGVLTQLLGGDKVAAYLKGLARHLPEYHDPSYWIPVLGWFCATPMTSLFQDDERTRGFPILLITGQHGSGKSTLVSDVIGRHFGCKNPRSMAKKGTTVFALKRGLGSNNVCPYVGDEFRVEEDDKSQGVQELVRGIWNRFDADSGLASGGIRKDHLITPLCLIGEAGYQDPASRDRTLEVHVNKQWVKELRERDRTLFTAARTWLHKNELTGILGAILLDHLKRNIDKFTDLLTRAIDVISTTCPIDNERKRTGFIAAYLGILVLSDIFKEHELPFFIKKKECLAALYKADERVMDKDDVEGALIRRLFIATDAAIAHGKRQHAPLEGSMYVIHPADPGIVYFQRTRWYEALSRQSNMQTLMRTERVLDEAILSHMQTDDPVILELNSKGFSQQGIKCDLNLIAKRYGIDTNYWLEEDAP